MPMKSVGIMHYKQLQKLVEEIKALAANPKHPATVEVREGQASSTLAVNGKKSLSAIWRKKSQCAVQAVEGLLTVTTVTNSPQPESAVQP